MKDKVIGYVFNSEGCYDKKYYFEGSIENVAKFIVQNCNSDTTITTTGDELIWELVIGSYLDVVLDEDILDKLITELIRLQKSKSFEPIEFEEVEQGVMQECESLEANKIK